MSQVWAFCPPPCRKITRGAEPPQRSALMGSRLDPLDFRQWTIDTGLLSVLSQQGKLVQSGQFVVR